MLYFSGVAGKKEAHLLLEAGVDTVLADRKDLRNTTGFPRVAVDSGAYRAYKSGDPLDVEAYIGWVRDNQTGKYDFFVAPDVIGDPAITRFFWNCYKNEVSLMPVWHWGSDSAWLKKYLDEAPVVGIGALVMRMRDKDDAMLKELKALCATHPGRFHIFGMNWLKAINHVHHLIASFDTSKFLDAARYRKPIFIHAKNGKLSQVPARTLGMDHLSRDELIVASARAMNEWCNLSLEEKRA